jgi:hypothetical protein
MECAFCHATGTGLEPASDQPGTTLYMCTDQRACMNRLDEINAATR